MRPRYAISLLIIVAIGQLVFLAGVQVQAQSSDSVDAISGETPTIDGTIAAGEWDDASSVVSGVKVYVKQDGGNLYIAFDVADNTPNDLDGLFICLDVTYNAGPEPQADDMKILVTRSGVPAEYVGNGADWVAKAKSGWNALTSSTSAMWQAELNISYTKLGDPYGKSKTMGVQFTVGDFGIPGIYYRWPGESNDLSPDTWGNLISSVNWIPEFHTEVAILLTLATTLIAVVTAREISGKHLRKNPHAHA